MRETGEGLPSPETLTRRSLTGRDESETGAAGAGAGAGEPFEDGFASDAAGAVGGVDAAGRAARVAPRPPLFTASSTIAARLLSVGKTPWPVFATASKCGNWWTLTCFWR